VFDAESIVQVHSEGFEKKEDPNMCAWGVLVLEEDVQQAGHSILCAPLQPIGGDPFVGL